MSVSSTCRATRRATINGPAQPNADSAVIFDLGTVVGTSGFLPVQTLPVTPEQVAQLRAGLWYVIIGRANNPAGEIRGQFRAFGRPAISTAMDVPTYRFFVPRIVIGIF